MNLSATLLLLDLIVGSPANPVETSLKRPSARSSSPMEHAVPGCRWCRDDDTKRALTGTRGSHPSKRGGSVRHATVSVGSLPSFPAIRIASAMLLSGRINLSGALSSSRAPNRSYQPAALSSFAPMASATPPTSASTAKVRSPAGSGSHGGNAEFRRTTQILLHEFSASTSMIALPSVVSLK